MTRVGLISDTHMPERWKQLPDSVFTLFADVDVILHSGDVGELWVLDQLSELAPVVAVHGNDETDEAEAALPYLQTLSIAGHRLVLTHAHYPDRKEEMASRTDEWQPKFERRIEFARIHGASICIFGHTHIPMGFEQDGIWLINPGAIASGNPWQKQLIQTVAILELEKNSPPQIQHFDLATVQPHTPFFDPAGFVETARHYETSIISEDVRSNREWLRWELRPVAPEVVKDAILSLSHECWSGERQIIEVRDIVERLVAMNPPQQVLDLLASRHPFSTFAQ